MDAVQAYKTVVQRVKRNGDFSRVGWVTQYGHVSRETGIPIPEIMKAKNALKGKTKWCSIVKGP